MGWGLPASVTWIGPAAARMARTGLPDRRSRRRSCPWPLPAYNPVTAVVPAVQSNEAVRRNAVEVRFGPGSTADKRYSLSTERSGAELAIRRMRLGDIDRVSRIANSAFHEAVAPGLSEEGVNTFSMLSSPRAFAARMKEDNLMFVFENGGEIEGVLELKEGRHVAMLFVLPTAQRRGVGRALMAEALDHARVRTITVSASIPSVPAYEAYGFQVVGAEEEKQGLVYVPMEIELSR